MHIMRLLELLGVVVRVYWVRNTISSWPESRHFYKLVSAINYYKRLQVAKRNPELLQSPEFEWEKIDG